MKPCGEELDTTENSFSQNKYLHSKIISFEFGGDEKDEFIFQFSLSEILDWVGIHHNFYVVVQATKVPAQYI